MLFSDPSKQVVFAGRFSGPFSSVNERKTSVICLLCLSAVSIVSSKGLVKVSSNETEQNLQQPSSPSTPTYYFIPFVAFSFVPEESFLRAFMTLLNKEDKQGTGLHLEYKTWAKYIARGCMSVLTSCSTEATF